MYVNISPKRTQSEAHIVLQQSDSHDIFSRINWSDPAGESPYLHIYEIAFYICQGITGLTKLLYKAFRYPRHLHHQANSCELWLFMRCRLIARIS